MILIVDSHPVHKSKKVSEYIESLEGKIELISLPLYAPDLNPDKLIFNQMRNTDTSKKSIKNRAIVDLENILNQ